MDERLAGVAARRVRGSSSRAYASGIPERRSGAARGVSRGDRVRAGAARAQRGNARAKLADVARPPGARDPRAWRATAGTKTLGTFYVDAVIGKQEYIDYALAVDSAGRVLRLEVLVYRETHGWEIRNDRWRAQFAGKTAQDPVAVNADIANISGATLSSRHVADGVRRLLALDAILRAR